MNASAAPDTSPTLLGRLRAVPVDQDAWRDFVGVYGVHILNWAKQWGLQDADAEDVTQDTMRRLAKTMCNFTYDPTLSFRGWLRTVAHHAWRDLARNKRPILLGELDQANPLVHLQADDELANALESAFDEELLRKAMASVRLRVEPQTWEAFRLMTLDQLSGAEAAAKLGVRLTTIYKARSNVQKMLQKEVRLLEEECDVVPLSS